MAENNLNPIIIKQTQETLGKYVKKPQLTDKLLNKPPFRFLHDVFKVLIRETGYFKGLYSTEELTFENIKDRDDKMRFLQKMIDVITLVTKKPLTVRTSKIVAGQEAEKTNEMLQLMAEVIAKELDWKSAVDLVSTKSNKSKEAAANLTTTTKNAEERNGKEQKKSQDNKIKSKKTNANATSNEKPQKNSEQINKVKSTKIIKQDINKSKEEIPNRERQREREIREKDRTARKIIKESSIEKSKAVKSKTTQPKNTKVPKNTKDHKLLEREVELAKETESVFEEEIKPQLVVEESKKNIGFAIAKQNEIISTTEKAAVPTTTTAAETAALAASAATSKISNSFDESLKLDDEQIDTVSKDSSTRTEISKDPEKNNKQKSSAKRRKSSASNSEELRILQNSSNSLHKDEPLEKPNTAANRKPSTELQQKSQQSPPPPPPPALPPTDQLNRNRNEMRRESTFTRENSKENNSGHNNNMRPRTSLRPPSARPASARPGAPRRRDKNVEIILQPNDQVKVNDMSIKLESFGNLDDDGENLVIIENVTPDNIINEINESLKTNDIEPIEENTGHLVKQILETQKELVQNGIEKGNTNDGQDLSTKGINGAVRQGSERNLINLRDVIQAITKSVNPFGKLMDFIPEDIDAMQLEMTMWRETYIQAAQELKREKSLNESTMEPMKNQLVLIDINIKEYSEMIHSSRMKILQNSEKLLKMLTGQSND